MAKFSNAAKPVGARLAREGGLTLNRDAGCSTAFASKPAPTFWAECYLSTLCLAAYRHSISIAKVAAASEVMSALS